MIALSLFDGMSCGQIALKELGIIPEIYYASEIDKHAIAQTQLNFPNTIQLGSVVGVDVSKLQRIGVLIGGSPCQSFSFAGKRKGMSTKCSEEIFTLKRYLELKADEFEFEGQSYLFWEYMRILTDIRKYNPNVKFLLENVEMSKKWERTLSEAIGVWPVHINSARVCAQNRKRLYWTNIRTRQEGLFGDLHADIPQPQDRGILLRDILDSNVPEKYYLSDKMLNYFYKRAANFNQGKVNIRDREDKATTLCASMASCDISDNFVIDTNGRIDSEKTGPLTACYDKGASNYSSDPYILDTKLKPKSDQHKSATFTAGGNSGGLHSDMDLICVAMRVRNPDNPSDRRTGSPTEQRLEPNLSGKTNYLTTVQKDNLVMQINPSTESGGVQPYQQNRVYDTDGISPCLNTDARAHAILEQLNDRQKNNFKNGDEKANTFLSTSWKGSQANGMTSVWQPAPTHRIRRLTPTECALLQTIPDWYVWKCSDTQQYRMLGNGWTVEVIKHILSYLDI